MNTISVIVPVFNGEKYLAETLKSIIQQTCPPAEIIVVDDGSTDHSAQVAETFPDVRVLRNPHRGLANTLNTGVRAASGALLTFLDADDRWLPNKLDIQLRTMTAQPCYDVVFGHSQRFDMRQLNGVTHEVMGSVMPGICKSTMMIWRSAFMRVGFFSEAPELHDFVDWYSRALEAELRTLMLPDIVYERRSHDANTGVINKYAQRKSYLASLHLAFKRRQIHNNKS